ncbi:MAG TPA: NADP-dependent phosphogluconate dehydrogenase [Gammaproteobacteria bacterium]|nr:NADP-dependent phosphogluconate dehydrogenase [Gammaproteobacteria bacterium]HIL96367.1 NADP-dependent phosphogluconate dehydrogenase [Pseudomonadales bacterium]
MTKTTIGVIGLGLMGRNLTQNLLEQLDVAVFSYNSDEVHSLIQPANSDSRLYKTDSIHAFVKTLDRPRKILLMVTAGDPVDRVIDDLVAILDRDDIIIDGGNSHFEDTHRRHLMLEQQGIQYLGTGISGGAKGARHGASVMVGGNIDAYNQCLPLFEAISTHINSDPCFDHVGPDGAGHYVKMVHNGIEYGIMQLIAETYRFMQQALGWSSERAGATFAEFNKGPLESYLVEITEKILVQPDELTGTLLLNLISDRAEQKGTGQWTVYSAMQLGVPIPTIVAAVTERHLSAMKDQREQASRLYPHSDTHSIVTSAATTVEDQAGWTTIIGEALLAAILCTYAQGFSLLGGAAREFSWGTNLGSVASLWRGGCIIRSALLTDIKQAFDENGELENLLLAPGLKPIIEQSQNPWRSLVAAGIQSGSSMPAMSASLAYVDSYLSETLPSNLIQAQRDFFGAHTFERTDREGKFHVDWEDA